MTIEVTYLMLKLVFVTLSLLSDVSQGVSLECVWQVSQMMSECQSEFQSEFQSESGLVESQQVLSASSR